MKLMKYRTLNCNIGFTTIELVIVLAIVGILGTAVVMSITQVFQGSLFSNNHNTAMNNVRNAGEWMSRDVLMADASHTLYAPTLWPLELIWYDQNVTRDKYYYKYELGGDTGTDLIRTFKFNGDSEVYTTVAQHITSVTVSFDTTDNVNTLFITISSPKDDKAWAATEDPQYLYTRTYEIHPRP
ncbi:MAG: type II secretion system protein [Dehalococcoidales bacterium]|nr:type II secretion system protein [Dehalococcoidales bacterium]